MKIKNFLSKAWSKVTLLICMATLAVSNATVTGAKADTLWDDTAETGIGKVIDSLTLFYRKWSLPFIFIGLILYAFSKDEKKREVEKKAVIIMIAVYILTFIWTWITGSIDDIGNTLMPSAATQ